MAIEFDCICGKKLSVPEEAAGRKAKCPSCNALVTVPGPRPPRNPPPQSEEEHPSKVDAMIDRLGEDYVQSKERAPQLTRFAAGLAILAGVTLLLTLFASLATVVSSFVVWVLVWLPMSAVGGLIAFGMIKADPRTPRTIAPAATLIIGANYVMFWQYALIASVHAPAVLMLLVTLANIGSYLFLLFYFRKHDTLLLFPEKAKEEDVVDESQPARGFSPESRSIGAEGTGKP